jgi:CRISPR-associated protein Cas6
MRQAAMSASMLDLSFPLEEGRELPGAHRAALATALVAWLPWLGDEPRAGVHRLNVTCGGSGARGSCDAGNTAVALLSRRTRLTLRLPRTRSAEAARALEGRALAVAGAELRLGTPVARELLPFATQYAHFVAAGQPPGGAGDEGAFLAEVQQQLHALGITGRAICGRHQVVPVGADEGALGGYSLMVDGLSPQAALRLAEEGIGAHRLWGCGLFTPHKSAAAVGMPDWVGPDD